MRSHTTRSTVAATSGTETRATRKRTPDSRGAGTGIVGRSFADSSSPSTSRACMRVQSASEVPRVRFHGQRRAEWRQPSAQAAQKSGSKCPERCVPRHDPSSTFAARTVTSVTLGDAQRDVRYTSNVTIRPRCLLPSLAARGNVRVSLPIRRGRSRVALRIRRLRRRIRGRLGCIDSGIIRGPRVFVVVERDGARVGACRYRRRKRRR